MIEGLGDGANMLFDADPTRRANNDDRNPAPGQVLLVSQILVGRDQHIESGALGLIEEFAICQRAPGKLQSGADLMIREISAQWRGRALVEQKPHSRGFQRVRSVLEYEPGLLARDSGKPGKKFRELCPILQILEQRDNGNARAAEHPGTTYALGIPLDGRTGRPIDHAAILGPQATRYNMRANSTGLPA